MTTDPPASPTTEADDFRGRPCNPLFPGDPSMCDAHSACVCRLESALAAAHEQIAAKGQLPEAMQDCTIRFIECPLGHGRLTATNWIDHGCDTCKVAALEARAHEWQKQAGEWSFKATEMEQQIAAKDAEIAALREGLKTVHELAAAVRHRLGAVPGSNIAQIEADAAALLGRA